MMMTNFCIVEFNFKYAVFKCMDLYVQIIYYI